MNISNQKELIIYPSPPDTARIQYLTKFSSSADVYNESSKFNKFIFGEVQPDPIVKPYGIAIYKGKIYICDTGNSSIEIIDLENHTFNKFTPKGFGELKLPLNCTFDEDGNLYVADSERKQVIIFDKEGNYINCIGNPDLDKPTDVYIYDNKIWISNLKQNKIYVYSKTDLKLLSTFPDAKQGDENFLYSPTNICISNNKIWVSDLGDFKIKQYTLDGNFVNSVGSYGNNIGQFVRPKGIALDNQSNLYVVDAGFENIQIFNNSGKLLMYFGGSYKKSGDMWLPAKVIVDYNNLNYFSKFVDPKFELQYLIFVTNQYGPDKVNVYGSVRMKQ